VAINDEPEFRISELLDANSAIFVTGIEEKQEK